MHPAYHGAQTGIPPPPRQATAGACEILLTSIAQVLISVILPSKGTSW